MNSIIINLTQHTFTAEQLAECQEKGFETVDTVDEVKGLLTFTTRPNLHELQNRAASLVAYARRHMGNAVFSETVVMCGGAPYFMPVLEQAFLGTGIRVVYSFSERASVETTQPDGSVVKTSVFRHAGFIPEL